MTLRPLLDAGPVIALHAAAALVAFALGLAQLLRRKGTPSHRVLGWVWVLLMGAVAMLSFRISTICTWRGFSAIHLLSVGTLVALPAGVISARRHDVRRHGRIMTGLFVGALVIAGGFTLIPGRVMHDVVFGTRTNDSNACPQAAAVGEG